MGRNDIARLGGPDIKTVQKILDGKFVRVGGLEKLVTALNHKKNWQQANRPTGHSK